MRAHPSKACLSPSGDPPLLEATALQHTQGRRPPGPAGTTKPRGPKGNVKMTFTHTRDEAGRRFASVAMRASALTYVEAQALSGGEP